MRDFIVEGFNSLKELVNIIVDVFLLIVYTSYVMLEIVVYRLIYGYYDSDSLEELFEWTLKRFSKYKQ